MFFFSTKVCEISKWKRTEIASVFERNFLCRHIKYSSAQIQEQNRQIFVFFRTKYSLFHHKPIVITSPSDVRGNWRPFYCAGGGDTERHHLQVNTVWKYFTDVEIYIMFWFGVTMVTHVSKRKYSGKNCIYMYNPHSTKHSIHMAKSSKIFNFKFQVQICNRGTHAFQMQVKLIIQDPFLLERIFLPPEWMHSCTSVKLGHTSCCVFKPICVTVWNF